MQHHRDGGRPATLPEPSSRLATLDRGKDLRQFRRAGDERGMTGLHSYEICVQPLASRCRPPIWIDGAIFAAGNV
jgi:hypothetical protein